MGYQSYHPNWRTHRRSGSEDLCGVELNGGKCLRELQEPPCFRVHDKARLAAWAATNGKRLCSFGRRCSEYPLGRCYYTHSPDQDDGDRVEKMHAQLTEPEVLDLDSLVSDTDTRVTGVRELASFNQLGDDEIAVPGMPPLFHKPTKPIDIKRDNLNGDLRSYPRFTHAFEPLLAAISLMQQPSTDKNNPDPVSTADLILSTGVLRKLLVFLLEDTSPVLERFDITWRRRGYSGSGSAGNRGNGEGRGKTSGGSGGGMNGGILFIGRWEADPRFNFSNGCGVGFERETCRHEADDELMARSFSHHRVVAYDLGGLRCVVRGEVDAYFCESHRETTRTAPPSTMTTTSSSPPTRATALSSSSSPPSEASLSFQAVVGKPINSKAKNKNNSSSSNRGRSAASSVKASSSPPRSLSSRRFSLTLTRGFDALSIDDPGDTPAYAASLASSSYSSTISSSYYLSTSPAISTSMRATTVTLNASTNLKVHFPSGRPIPSSCLLELKTRNAKNPKLAIPEAQLYFSGRYTSNSSTSMSRASSTAVSSASGPYLYSATHHNRVFSPSDGQLEDLGERMKVWESDAKTQKALGRVVALLRVLRERVAEICNSSVSSEGDDDVIGEGEGEEVALSLVLDSGHDGEGEWKRERNSLPSARLFRRRDGVRLVPATF